MVVLAQRSGAYGAAQACLLAGITVLPVNYALALTQLRLSPLPIMSLLWRPFAAAASMYWIVCSLLEHISPPTHGLAGVAWLLFSATAGCVSYFAIVATLWILAGRPRGPESLILERMRGARPL
jgi:hypothetical protein